MFGFQGGRDSSCRNPHAQSCGEQPGSHHTARDPSKSLLHLWGTFQGRQRGKSAEKNSVQLLVTHRWAGREGGLGAVSSILQIFQLLLPGLCFALRIYSKGGHRRALLTFYASFLIFPIWGSISASLPIPALPHPSTKNIHPLSSSFPLFPPPFPLGLDLAPF